MNSQGVVTKAQADGLQAPRDQRNDHSVDENI
jgi:hypothetical protein